MTVVSEGVGASKRGRLGGGVGDEEVLDHCCIEPKDVLATAQAAKQAPPWRTMTNRASEPCRRAPGRADETSSSGPIVNATMPSPASGRTSILFNASRQLGSAVGIATLTTVIATIGTTHQIAGQLIPQLSAYHWAFVTAAAVALLAAALAPLLTARPPHPPCAPGSASSTSRRPQRADPHHRQMTGGSVPARCDLISPVIEPLVGARSLGCCRAGPCLSSPARQPQRPTIMIAEKAAM